jgi:hypothetical protein
MIYIHSSSLLRTHWDSLSSTIRLLATDLRAETVTQILTIIMHEIFQSHFQYVFTVAHLKSSIHTLHLHRQTSCILLFWASGIHLEMSKTKTVQVKVKVTLLLMDSQSVSLGVEPPSGAHDQIFFTVWHLRSGFCGAPSLTRGRVFFFVYAAGPCQHSLSLVRVPWNSRPYFTVSDYSLPIVAKECLLRHF